MDALEYRECSWNVAVHKQNGVKLSPNKHMHTAGRKHNNTAHNQRLVLLAHCNLGSPKSSLSNSEQIGVASHLHHYLLGGVGCTKGPTPPPPPPTHITHTHTHTS